VDFTATDCTGVEEKISISAIEDLTAGVGAGENISTSPIEALTTGLDSVAGAEEKISDSIEICFLG